MNEAVSIADWVIVGAPHGQGVRVTASKNLKPGGSVTIVEREDVVHAGRMSAPTLRHDHYRIVVLAEDIAIADGPDYPSALRLLFSIWQVPESPEPVREIFTRDRYIVEGRHLAADSGPSSGEEL